MKIFVAGATGAVGKRLIPLFVNAGHDVTGTTRRPDKVVSIRSSGATPALVNALNADEVLQAVRKAMPEVIIHQLTAIPERFNLRRFDEEFAPTNRLRTEGTDHLLAAARVVGCRRFIAQSYTGWPYARTGGWVKTEEDPLISSPEPGFRESLKAITHVESTVLAAKNIEGFVLRYGSFYGPGTSLGPGGSVLEDVRRRRVPIVGEGTAYWSFLHIDDAATATLAAVEGNTPGLYNIADDEPAPVSQWLPFLAETLGAKPPRHIPVWLGRIAIGQHGVAMMTAARGASNQKAKSLLPWKLKWPSWRKGFREGLEDRAPQTGWRVLAQLRDASYPQSVWLTHSGPDVSFPVARDIAGAQRLSQAAKPQHLGDRLLISRDRRNFLVRCCQGLSATLVPVNLWSLALPSSSPSESPHPQPAGGEYLLHPHYRAKLPVETALLKTAAGTDKFVTEKYADQIGAILSEWSAALRQAPTQTGVIEKAFSPDFLGSSFAAIASRLIRSGASLEVRQNKFSGQSVMGRDAFLRSAQSALGTFSKIITAEFQIVAVDAGPAPNLEQLRTRVRYDLVGAGQGFHREQRVGEWELEWEAGASGEFRLRNWRTLDETRSRSSERIFTDVGSQVLGRNSSYSSQLHHGADYWRTLLDVASGIDVYGHNGVSVGDIDDDGFDDLYICQPASLPNRLYRNRGDGTFEDITEASGAGVLEDTACALFADIDNDGRQDLIVVCQSGPLLFLNQGGGKFKQKLDAFRFAQPPEGTFAGAAIADYDRDGWLDIYFCLYLYYRGTEPYKSPSPFYDAQNGPPNFLMRNQRDGTFRDVTAETGLNHNNKRYSFCCGWSDYNHDGWPDLYVVNDFGRKNLYRNNGDGTFTDVAPEAGVEDVGAGMSVCWLDYDGDGDEDLYVANMWTAAGKRISTQAIFQKDAPEDVRALYRKHAMGNSLFRNNQGGSFQIQPASAGVEMGRWSWASDAWDFDHDGFPDLYITNGMISGQSGEDLNSFFWRQVVAQSPTEAKSADDYEQGWDAINQLIRADGTWSGFERNVFYANNRDGSFSDVSGVVEMDFLEDGRSFALSDFDHDGRLEAFLKNRNSPQLRVLKNVMKDLPPSIAFLLRGTKSNRDAIGAVVTVETESRRQTRSLQAGSGFLSQHSKELFFGLGEVKGPVQASIRWPSGLVQEIHDLPINHRVWIEEGSQPSRFEAFQTSPQSLHAVDVISQSMKPEPLPREAETWLLVPVSAPDFSLSDLAGRAHALESFRGRALLLNFSTTASPGCKQELNLLNQAHKRWAAQGLQLLTVNVDDPADPEKLQALARSLSLSFPMLLSSQDVASIYNILYRYLFDRQRDMQLPTSFLIDAKGDIVKVYQGSIHPEHVEADHRSIPQTDIERLALALPFPGLSDGLEFRRNYYGYGSIYFQHGYYDQAEASFRLALNDDPSNAEALYGLGSVYLKKEKNAEARETFERTVKLKTNYPKTLTNAWNNLGILSAREGKMPEAVSYFQEALRLDPDHLVALDNLGAAYRQLQNWDEARQTLERALKVKPDDPEANYSLGMVFAQTGDSDRAYELLQKALQLRPGYPEALNNLGILYLRTHRIDEAVASFEECIRVAPAFSRCYMDLAQVYALEGAPEKARAVLFQLLKQHPDDVQAQRALEQLPK